MPDRDFPGGAVVKNPPANAGDMGSIPGPGRSHKKKKKKGNTYIFFKNITQRKEIRNLIIDH